MYRNAIHRYFHLTDDNGELRQYHVLLVDGDRVLVTDGLEKRIIPASELDKAQDITNDLVLRNYQHKIAIYRPEATATEILNLYKMFLNLCLDLTRRWSTPIDLVKPWESDTEKDHITSLKDAVGIWRVAHPILEDQPIDEEGKETVTTIAITLEGDLFCDRLRGTVLPEDIEDVDINQLQRYLQIETRFLTREGDELPYRIDFDVIPKPDEKAVDETMDYALGSDEHQS